MMAESPSNRRGVWLVVGLLGFGLLLTGALYVYAVMHRGPFRELTTALERQFPDSAPRVEGGKRRLNEPGDRILRITMRFDSVRRDPDKTRAFADRLAQFVGRRPESTRHDVLKVHLYRRSNANTLAERSFCYTLAESQSSTQNGDTSNQNGDTSN